MKLVIAMFISCVALAQIWVQERTTLSAVATTPRIDGLVTAPVAGKFGGFLWFQTEKGLRQKGYGQAYGGPTYLFKPWLQIAGGIGIEEADQPTRVGGFLWMGDSKTSMLFVPEYGGSGFWWKLEVNRKIAKSIGVGLLTERFKGTGPRIEYKIPCTPFLLWTAPMFERGRTNAIFAIRWVIK